MSIVLVGVNHKTAPIEVRELLAFSDEACTDGLRRLVDGEIVREGLIVYTCNRVEIYSDNTKHTTPPPTDHSRRRKKITKNSLESSRPLPQGSLNQHIYSRRDEEA